MVKSVGGRLPSASGAYFATRVREQVPACISGALLPLLEEIENLTARILVAVFATARKLATIIYRLLRWGQPYVDEGAETYEQRYRDNRVKSLTARAKELGYQLTPTTA